MNRTEAIRAELEKYKAQNQLYVQAYRMCFEMESKRESLDTLLVPVPFRFLSKTEMHQFRVDYIAYLKMIGRCDRCGTLFRDNFSAWHFKIVTGKLLLFSRREKFKRNRN